MDTIFILKKTPKNVLHVKQRNVKKKIIIHFLTTSFDDKNFNIYMHICTVFLQTSHTV